jgi:hypothetical protein
MYRSKSSSSYLKSVLAALVMVMFLTVGSACRADEMKIPYGRDIDPAGGANARERKGDHMDSPYFSRLDFYNMASTGSLTILPKFKTIQQTGEWSCGPAAALMVLEYFGVRGDHDDLSLAMLRPQKDEPGPTTLRQELKILEAAGGLEMISTLDYQDRLDDFHLSGIRDFLKAGMPVLICWNDWGGHWQVIIGYDDMGTEIEQDDVIIVADPYDSTDHNQDGYGVYSAERFFYNFTMYDYFPKEEGNDKLFIAVRAAR